jgi:SAM-dependent methyltransferase
MADTRTEFIDEQYANAYPPGAENHYWHQARNRILLRKLQPVAGPGAKVLDIGCGPGIVVDHLRRSGVDCVGVDLGSPRPATEFVAPFLNIGMSAFDLPDTMRASFSILLLLDALEHLPAPIDFLRECRRSFPGTRHILVTLPARMELWSSYDEYYGHHLRYTLESLSEIAARTELRLVRSGYFFHALYAAARLALMRSKERSHRVSTPSPRFAHALFGRFLAIEEAMVPGWVPGSTLYALFEAP